jgi:hypothetical protein
MLCKQRLIKCVAMPGQQPGFRALTDNMSYFLQECKPSMLHSRHALTTTNNSQKHTCGIPNPNSRTPAITSMVHFYMVNDA